MGLAASGVEEVDVEHGRFDIPEGASDRRSDVRGDAKASGRAGGLSFDVSGRLSAEARWFPEGPAHRGQLPRSNSLVVSPSVHVGGDASGSFSFTPFYRLDGDDPERSHGDLREAYVALWGGGTAGQWELRIGVDRVFWGIAESNHLIDIVNQTDLVEHPDEKAKLGQPMARFVYSWDWGGIELLALPIHRQRTFAGGSGRLRPPIVVDPRLATYESGAEERHLDMAARYSVTFGPLDAGLSVFRGTSREPFLTPVVDERRSTVLAPHYRQIRQVALDLQVTLGAWLLKLETLERDRALNRVGEEEDYRALVVGGEYQLPSLLGAPVDASVVAEWHYDDRGQNATTRYQHDLFVAMRVGLNDFAGTELTVGALVGTDHASRLFTAKLSRRAADRWRVHLEAVALDRLDAMDVFYDLRRDSFIEFGLTYSF